MDAADETIEGGCLCGAVRYRTQAAPINIRVCHCRTCQRAIGTAFNARVLVPLDRLAITGTPGWHRSSAELRRGFCPACGTSLFSERAAGNVIGLTIGSLDQPQRFTPESHIWLSSHLPWLCLEDGLARHAAGAPGGNGPPPPRGDVP